MKNANLIHCWIKFRISLLFILIIASSASAQVESINWIDKNADELKSDCGNKDLSFLSKKLKDKSIVGLGEASHGTHEFYVQKARIVQYLIDKCDFKLVTFEAPQSMTEPINLYLQSGQGNLKELMRNMGLYNTREIYDFFQKIREYNKDKAVKDRVELAGVDNEDYWGNPFTRDKFMAENLIRFHEAKKSKTIVWAHNVHLVKDSTSKYLSMGSYLKQHFGDKFYAIGFDTYKGTVNILNKDKFEAHTFQAQESSFSSILAKAKYKSFFLSFDKKSPFMGVTSLITNIYSNWQQEVPKPLSITPGLDFDAIVFIRDTSASIKLEQE